MDVIIIEDELKSRENLKLLLNKFCKDITVLDMAHDVSSAISIIETYNPDLIFLDIELQTGTGFEVLQKIKKRNFEVIFTTAFEQYALKAIKFSSIDYLLKPIDLEELQQAIAKVRLKKDKEHYKEKLELLLRNISEQPNEKSKICLATGDGLEFIAIKDIIYCEASGSYTNFHLVDNKKLMVSKNLKEYEHLFENHQFMRVHNSFLVNLEMVKKFIKSEGGYILMKNDAQISISQGKRDIFLLKMSQLR
ncbi:response regulator transcription factor [Marivirga sp. S37H4]|uniref:Response regulator transcription factor n=1 Tax=Marivirga aurantiaca TaxID=2802615 RepID=A0A934WWF2_9BACT|nr:LytTR family DNA-binding domain-containing protein [Marivirga aurantiaca]MBK6264329.1 response regulator transcription factor [Marivirga aurantiaca]